MLCTIEIFNEGVWQECCTVTAGHPERGGTSSAWMEYDMGYVFGAPNPASLRFPVNSDVLRLSTWPSFLFDLIPQGKGRQHLVSVLGIKEGPGADWPLLRAGAFNPIGRLRVKEAVDFYNGHVANNDPGLLGMGFTREAILERQETFIEYLHMHAMLSSGTSGVQGVAPKFLLTLGKDGLYYADGAIDDAKAAVHYLVKMPRGRDPSDLRILQNEAAYIRVAHRMGVVAEKPPELVGDMLFVRRFDRVVTSKGVERLHQESVASLVGQIGYDNVPTQNEALAALRKHATDPLATTIEYLKRDVLNLALGNTDNHARNTAMQVTAKGIHLTPLFDFAPMFLDKEGIARALRWRTPDKKELKDWGAIIDHLEQSIGADDACYCRAALFAFSLFVEKLQEIMKTEGVDERLIENRHYAIEEQVKQLRSLGAPTRAKDSQPGSPPLNDLSSHGPA